MRFGKNDIDELLKGLRDLPENVSLETINQVVDQYNYPGPSSNLNPFSSWLKSLIMTSIIIISIATLFFLNQEVPKSVSTERANPVDETTTPTNPQENSVIKSQEKASAISKPHIQKIPDPKIKYNTQVPISTPQIKEPVLAKHNQCNWPEDTLIDGKKLIITPDREQLEKLGFLINKSGIFYKNKYQGEIISFHSRYELKNGYGGGETTGLITTPHKKNMKTEFSKNNFFPVYITDVLFSTGTNNQEEFKMAKDTLVPVILNMDTIVSKKQSPLILWFSTTDAFFDIFIENENLKNTYKCIKRLKYISNREVVIYQAKSLIGISNFLELNNNDLKLLGFNIQKNKIEYTQTDTFCDFKINLSEVGEGIHIMGKDSGESSKINLVFVTDKRGLQNIKWDCRSDTEKMNWKFFKNNHQVLIPILLDSIRYPIMGDRIFWFEASQELLQLIPGALGSQIREEYNYLVSEDKSGLETTCTFFEACRATLHLHNLKLFPNPTSDFITIEFNLSEKLKGDISLGTISGIKYKVLRQLSYFAAGLNRFKFDVSDVPAGIYLLTITTDKGFKTQRLMITR